MDSAAQLKFIELYTTHQKKIYLYILSMVHHLPDADDLMQQTAASMWQMFDRYEEGTNFAGWGVSIARFRILEYRKQDRKRHLFLSEEIYQHIIDNLEEAETTSDARASALKGCLKRLKPSDYKLVQLHYGGRLSYRKIAEQHRLSKTGIYKVMTRIHTNLHDCIRKTLMLWEAGS
jgi:RNA polymerase sigma-70 factor (ECF subfamily)